ncbi:MFS transporter [Paenibacillus sp. sgz500958]|uniref:MFS transporter n=1 Tax=Paenibacillus sp. sgz500958 TaxID=3242475 RepID=UPI0036D2354D
MFRNRYVRTIIMSRVLLQLGVWVRNFAILLYVTDITRNDPFYVSLISVAEFAPIFLFGIIGGTLADRWRPKRTMILSDFLSSLSVFAVLFVVIHGSWRALLLATFLSAVMSQFSQPSAMKLFKQHVSEDQLQGVMAMFQSLSAFFMIIGPVIGAFIYNRYGIEVSLVIMGVMFIGSGLILSLLPADESGKSARNASRVTTEMIEGLQYVGRSPVLRTLGLTFAFTGLGVGLIQPLGLYVVMENLGQQKDYLQWFMMVNGAATLLGGAYIMGVAKKVKPQTLMAVGLFVSAVGTAGVGWSHSILLTFCLQALTGFIYPCVHVGINTLILRNTEGAFMGRVGGIMMPMFMGLMVIGMSLAGWLKDVLTLVTVYAGSSLLFLIGMVILLPLIRGNTSKQESREI